MSFFFLGFDDVLDILETLTPLDFCLPEDLAIRHLTRANEAFGDNYWGMIIGQIIRRLVSKCCTKFRALCRGCSSLW
jgi:hypothetical protein